MITRTHGLTACRVLALTLLLCCLGGLFLVPNISAAPLEISIPDTSLYPGQSLDLPLIVTTDVDTLVAFQVSYNMDRPNVMQFPTDTIVDTLILCLNPPECTEMDTTIETVASVPYTAVDNLCENWDYIRAVTIVSEFNLRISGFADLSCGCDNAIMPFTTNEIMCRVQVDALCHPDPFGGEEVNLHGVDIASSFSAPGGRSITSFTLNPGTITLLPLVTCDLDYSGFPDATDLQAYIQCVFFNSCPECDAINLDYNCDGQPDATDLNMMIDYLFFNAPEPTCP